MPIPMTRKFQSPRWTDRIFQFGYTNDYIPFFLERLSCTAPGIAELTGPFAEELLRYQPGGRWSVKQHIGHLDDLEILHTGRLEDFQNQSQVLRAADMMNRKTEEADHNSKDLATLLQQFRESRTLFFEKLYALDDAALAHKAMHPRLQKIVGVADILYFMGEHDTHHLMRMTEVLAAII